ncbi:hypothetical protein QOZ95_004235 [Paenibacillus brasilensis]|uniref:Uncharacterized protein n=1 Tax=Paenibacillus brasilensis TaxID=128574 RepID=A0ABU0L429_9BACL|nr:hypothetical protein [Paenibacillus brasilensis]
MLDSKKMWTSYIIIFDLRLLMELSLQDWISARDFQQTTLWVRVNTETVGKTCRKLGVRIWIS